LIGTLRSIMQEKPTSKKNFMVGIGVKPKEGLLVEYTYPQFAMHDTDVWVIEFYSVDLDFTGPFQKDWGKVWRKEKQPVVLPIFQVDSFNQTLARPNETAQRIRFCQMLQYFYTNKVLKWKNWGMGFLEFSDEWWRSSLEAAETGFDLEGCPNSNPYAHTACGIGLVRSQVLSVEYTGLYELRDLPFHFCYKPKEVVAYLAYAWGNTSLPPVNGSNAFDLVKDADLFCVPIKFIIPWEAFYGLIPLTVAALVLILILEPPRPPEVIPDTQDGVELNNPTSNV